MEQVAARCGPKPYLFHRSVELVAYAIRVLARGWGWSTAPTPHFLAGVMDVATTSVVWKGGVNARPRVLPALSGEMRQQLRKGGF